MRLRKLIAAILFLIFIELISYGELNIEYLSEKYGIILMRGDNMLYEALETNIVNEGIENTLMYNITGNLIEDYNSNSNISNINNISDITNYFMMGIYLLKGYVPENYNLTMGLYHIDSNIGWHQDPSPMFGEIVDNDIRFIIFSKKSEINYLTEFSTRSNYLIPDKESAYLHQYLEEFDPISRKRMMMGSDLYKVDLPKTEDNSTIIVGFDNNKIFHQAPYIFEKVLGDRYLYILSFSWNN